MKLTQKKDVKTKNPPQPKYSSSSHPMYLDGVWIHCSKELSTMAEARLPTRLRAFSTNDGWWCHFAGLPKTPTKSPYKIHPSWGTFFRRENLPWKMCPKNPASSQAFQQFPLKQPSMGGFGYLILTKTIAVSQPWWESPCKSWSPPSRDSSIAPYPQSPRWGESHLGTSVEWWVLPREGTCPFKGTLLGNAILSCHPLLGTSSEGWTGSVFLGGMILDINDTWKVPTAEQNMHPSKTLGWKATEKASLEDNQTWGRSPVTLPAKTPTQTQRMPSSLNTLHSSCVRSTKFQIRTVLSWPQSLAHGGQDFNPTCLFDHQIRPCKKSLKNCLSGRPCGLEASAKP